MFVKYQINVKEFSGVTGVTINIPLSMDNHMVDQSELIKDKFIPQEVKKAINIPLDNEKVRFVPVLSINTPTIAKYVNYNIIFSATTGGICSKFSEITTSEPFIQEDLKYRRQNLINTSLKLLFFTEGNETNGYLVTTMDLFVNIPNPTQVLLNLPVQFSLSNPISNPEGFSEGFYIYHYKDDVDFSSSAPKELYMRAEFHNAKDGSSIRLVKKEGSIFIKELNPNTYTRYLLTRTSDGYYYTLDPTYLDTGGNTNITITSTDIVVKLYESIVA